MTESNYMCSWRLPNTTVKKSRYYEPSAPGAWDVAATDDNSSAESALLSAIAVGEAVHGKHGLHQVMKFCSGTRYALSLRCSPLANVKLIILWCVLRMKTSSGIHT